MSSTWSWSPPVDLELWIVLFYVAALLIAAAIVEAVARMLGNTPAICRRCYVHPVVLESYLDGTLVDQLKRQAEQKLTIGIRRLPPDEAAVLMLLQQTLSRRPRKKA